MIGDSCISLLVLEGTLYLQPGFQCHFNARGMVPRVDQPVSDRGNFFASLGSEVG
jgi:hypothetical protein